MMLRFSKIKYILQQKNIKQAISLLSVNILGIPLGIITNIIVTRYLGPQLFGDYMFVQSVFNIAIVFFNFGLFYAGNRAILLSKDNNKSRELYGSMLLLLALLACFISILVALYALFDKNVAEKELSTVLLFSLPVGWIALLGKLCEELFPADNRIDLLTKSRLFTKVLNLLFVSAVFFFFKYWNINKLALIIIIYALTQLIVYAYCMISVKPIFCSSKKRIREIANYNKTYGFNVFLGSLFASGFTSLTDLLISYFGADNAGVGFYSLAVTLSTPLLFIPATIATTNYQSFAELNKIPQKLFRVTLLVSFIALIGLWIIVPPFVKICYGNAFEPVIRINFFVSVGMLGYGMADFINRFLCAKGAGKELRNASFIVGAGVMAANLLFIPHFGEYGAAYAKIIASVVFLSVEIFYYNRIIRNA